MLDDRVAFINMATAYQLAKGYKASWVYVMFKKMYGAWPGDAFKERVSAEPSAEFLAWATAQQKDGIQLVNEREGKRLVLAEQAKLKTLHKLHPRRGKTANQLAQKFGVTARTVQRYTSIPRSEYEANAISRSKPWEVLGMSRATWYRHGKPTETKL